MDADKIINKTPEAVLESFLPTAEAEGFSMAQWLMLESVGCGIIVGSPPCIYDWVAMWLIKHDPEKIKTEIEASRARAYIHIAVDKISPAQLAVIQLEMAPALAATFAPLMTGAEPKKKKSGSSAVDGGSGSTTPSPTSIAGIMSLLCGPPSGEPSP